MRMRNAFLVLVILCLASACAGMSFHPDQDSLVESHHYETAQVSRSALVRRYCQPRVEQSLKGRVIMEVRPNVAG